MKYTTEKALSEIRRRSEQIVIRRERRTCRRLSGAAGILLVLLLLVITVLPGKTATGSAEGVYGAFLLSPEAGGYVLAGVIAFALGIVITLLCLRYTQKSRSSGTRWKSENETIYEEEISDQLLSGVAGGTNQPRQKEFLPDGTEKK